MRGLSSWRSRRTTNNVAPPPPMNKGITSRRQDKKQDDPSTEGSTVSSSVKKVQPPPPPPKRKSQRRPPPPPPPPQPKRNNKHSGSRRSSDNALLPSRGSKNNKSQTRLSSTTKRRSKSAPPPTKSSSSRHRHHNNHSSEAPIKRRARSKSRSGSGSSTYNIEKGEGGGTADRQRHTSSHNHLFSRNRRSKSVPQHRMIRTNNTTTNTKPSSSNERKKLSRSNNRGRVNKPRPPESTNKPRRRRVEDFSQSEPHLGWGGGNIDFKKYSRSRSQQGKRETRRDDNNKGGRKSSRPRSSNNVRGTTGSKLTHSHNDERKSNRSSSHRVHSSKRGQDSSRRRRMKSNCRRRDSSRRRDSRREDSDGRVPRSRTRRRAKSEEVRSSSKARCYQVQDEGRSYSPSRRSRRRRRSTYSLDHLLLIPSLSESVSDDDGSSILLLTDGHIDMARSSTTRSLSPSLRGRSKRLLLLTDGNDDDGDESSHISGADSISQGEEDDQGRDLFEPRRRKESPTNDDEGTTTRHQDRGRGFRKHGDADHRIRQGKERGRGGKKHHTDASLTALFKTTSARRHMSRDRQMHSSRRTDVHSDVPSVVMNYGQSLFATSSSRRSKSYDARRTTPWGTTKAKSWVSRRSSVDGEGPTPQEITSILRPSLPSRSKSMERSRKNDSKLGQQDPIIQSTDNEPVHCPKKEFNNGKELHRSSPDIEGLAQEITSMLRPSSPSRSKSIERSRKNDCKMGQQDPIIQSTNTEPVHCPRSFTKGRSFTKSTSLTQLPPPPPTRVDQGHVSSPNNSKPRESLPPPPPPPPPPRPPKPSTNNQCSPIVDKEEPVLTNATARAKGLKYVMQLKYSDKYGGSGLYTGELDEWGRPSGQGFMKYEDGKFYEGSWIDGVPDAVEFASQNPSTPAAGGCSSVMYAGGQSVTAGMVYGGGSVVAQPMMYVNPNMIPQGGYQYNVMHQQMQQQQMQVPMIGHGMQHQNQGQQL